MDKFAQERGFFNKMREKMNLPGSYLDKFFKPELERIMSALRIVDDKIRAELSGKTIGEKSPEIARSAKDLLRDARRNFARREYMTGAADLGMFHKKMALVAAEINKWEVDVNRIHHRFLFQGVDEDKIKNLRQHMEGKTAQEQYEKLIKRADVMDFFYNLVSPRSRALAAWEKKYPQQTKALREGGPKMVEAAQSLLDNTISLLKEMATARAVRRPDDYMNAANKIVAEYNKFDAGDKGFRSFYQKAILPFLSIKDEIDKKIKTETPKPTPVNVQAPQKMELGYQIPGPPPLPNQTPQPTSTSPQVPSLVTPTTPAPIQSEVPESDVEGPLPDEEEAPITERTPAPKHAQFFALLESMSNENPLILSGVISKYAKSIQGSDPETAIELFSIVKRLKG